MEVRPRNLLVVTEVSDRFGGGLTFVMPKNREYIFPERHHEDDSAADHPNKEEPGKNRNKEPGHSIMKHRLT